MPLQELKNDYYRAMSWNVESGNLSAERARKLGLSDLLAGYVDA